MKQLLKNIRNIVNNYNSANFILSAFYLNCAHNITSPIPFKLKLSLN